MAKIQDKWYSWTAALRPRVQKMNECDLRGMSASHAVSSSAIVRIGLKFERPHAAEGHYETLNVDLSPAEIEKIWAFYSEMKSKYGVD